MSARIRRVDVVLAFVVVVSLVAVGSTMLAGLGPAEQQARCAANMRLFGEALAGYEAVWGVFPPCDPWPAMPACVDGACRDLSWGLEIWDPPHGRLLYHMGYVPNIPPEAGATLRQWYSQPWGFYYASLFLGVDGVPPPAICPSAILENVMSETSTEINFGGSDNGQNWVQTRYKYAACYTPNRLLRSATFRDGAERRLPRLPEEIPPSRYGELDNVYHTPCVLLDVPPYDWYAIQGVNSDEVLNPAGTLYLCDSRDYRIGHGDELVDPRYGSAYADTSAGMWFALHWWTPAGTPLGARHNGKSNVLYVDGHVSDDNQTPRNRRGELVTASTFADFIEDYGIGTQHHLMPGWRWVDQTLSPPDSYAPGDDEPPTVIRTWPADGAAVARNRSVEVTIQFSEQVYVNSTNVTINGGAVVATAASYGTQQAGFTLFFDPPLAAGSYLVIVNPAVTDRVGNQLDGDGNGTAGDAFWFDFTVYNEVITVDPNDGDYATIQAAIDAAVDGDVIEVQPGVYVERVDFAGKAVTVRSVDPADPNVVAATVIDAGPLPSGPVVTFDDGEGPGSVLDGLTVTHSGDYGDGVCIEGSSPTVRRCRITANQGSGIWCFEGCPTVERNVILGNTAVDGAGVYCFNSAAVIRSNVIADNHAYEEGAAIYTGGYSDDWVVSNTIVSNTADGDGLGGAAVVCVLAGNAGLFNNLFWQNGAEDLAVFDSDPAVACNLFSVVPIDFEGHGNIADDPLLSDYHIGYNSPCVNAGSPWYGPMDGVTDLDGEPRIGLGRVDIGADEIAAPQTFIVDWQGSGDFLTIQEAIDAAPGHHEIITVLQGTYAENIDFLGKALTVTGTDLEDPNVVAATIIEGGPGTVVSFVSDEGRDSVITGLTIRHAVGASGVGVSCNHGPTICKNAVTGNDEGGIRGGAPAILENAISLNGGNVSQGGGVYVNGSGARIIGNRIVQNQAIDTGGGVYGDRASALEVARNRIEDNTAGQHGGGMFLDFRDIYQKAPITNNLFVRNTAAGIAALCCLQGTPVVVQHNTFAFNVGQYALMTTGDPERFALATGLENCVLFDPDTVKEADSFGTSDYCLIRGWTGGDELGNFDADPQFVDPNDGDYHLLPSSPCVNAGDPSYFVGPDVTDLDGNPRLQRGRVDIGCYETPYVSLLVSEPPADGTLPRASDNVIELVFNGTISPLPSGAPVSIAPLTGGDEVTGSFSIELATTTVADDTLRAVENGSALPNQTWYRIEPVPGLDVVPFVLDVCTLIGDADGSGHVTTGDYAEEKLHLGQRGDIRRDLDANGRVTTADYTVVKAHMGEEAPAKPGL
ncbi:MAG TPA: right-handed parallel beta-helix repeat-containing protein [Phycisphaerae bacterium]|nr:right-handed parallel beta-helix repeat-containing protein [Phycisphaerae bacterium]